MNIETLKTVLEEIKEFFELAVDQLDKENTIPTGKEEVIKYVTTLGDQINWILRDSDKIPSKYPEMCKELYGYGYSKADIKFYMMDVGVNSSGYRTIHYAQYFDGRYHCIISNSDILTYDLDEMKNWVLKQLEPHRLRYRVHCKRDGSVVCCPIENGKENWAKHKLTR